MRQNRVGAAAAVLLVMGSTAPAASTPPAAAVQVLQLRADLDMLTVEGLNIGVEFGPQGVIVVDSGPARDVQQVLQAIQKLSLQPIRYVIDTSADAVFTGGNAQLSQAGLSLQVGWAPLLQAANQIRDIRQIDARRAPIIARLGVIEQMVGSQAQSDTLSEALPTDTFTRPEFNFRVNDQAIQVVAMPPAHSAADSVVLFRGSDVVVTGAIFDDTRFPVIDLQHGGSIDGEIDAVNQVLNTLVVADVPLVSDAGGTWIIPERGPVCNQLDLLTYRDMLSAVRNRVQALVQQGRSLQQVQAADPAQGYETRYGASAGDWTTRDFISAVYQSLRAGHAQGRRKS